MYQLQSSITLPNGDVIVPNGIIRLSDNATIPKDDQNTDWQQYQVWLSEGNQPLPPAGA